MAIPILYPLVKAIAAGAAAATGTYAAAKAGEGLSEIDWGNAAREVGDFVSTGTRNMTDAAGNTIRSWSNAMSPVGSTIPPGYDLRRPRINAAPNDAIPSLSLIPPYTPSPFRYKSGWNIYNGIPYFVDSRGIRIDPVEEETLFPWQLGSWERPYPLDEVIVWGKYPNTIRVLNDEKVNEMPEIMFNKIGDWFKGVFGKNTPKEDEDEDLEPDYTGENTAANEEPEREPEGEEPEKPNEPWWKRFFKNNKKRTEEILRENNKENYNPSREITNNNILRPTNTQLVIDDVINRGMGANKGTTASRWRHLKPFSGYKGGSWYGNAFRRYRDYNYIAPFLDLAFGVAALFDNDPDSGVLFYLTKNSTIPGLIATKVPWGLLWDKMTKDDEAVEKAKKETVKNNLNLVEVSVDSISRTEAPDTALLKNYQTQLDTYKKSPNFTKELIELYNRIMKKIKDTIELQRGVTPENVPDFLKNNNIDSDNYLEEIGQTVTYDNTNKR